MVIRRLTDSLILVTDPRWSDVAKLARRLNARRFPGIEEVTASYSTIGIYGRPEQGWEVWLEDCTTNYDESVPDQLHVIPVCYELNDDLDVVARRLHLSREAVIEAHLSSDYRCFAVGFQPGFAYLGPLPGALSGLTRLDQPRNCVVPGSVGICQNQTGVYPSASPGGWHLIGRCPFELVHVEDEYFPLEAGDHVRFRRVSAADFDQLAGIRL